MTIIARVWVCLAALGSSSSRSGSRPGPTIFTRFSTLKFVPTGRCDKNEVPLNDVQKSPDFARIFRNVTRHKMSNLRIRATSGRCGSRNCDVLRPLPATATGIFKMWFGLAPFSLAQLPCIYPGSWRTLNRFRGSSRRRRDPPHIPALVESSPMHCAENLGHVTQPSRYFATARRADLDSKSFT